MAEPGVNFSGIGRERLIQCDANQTGTGEVRIYQQRVAGSFKLVAVYSKVSAANRIAHWFGVP